MKKPLDTETHAWGKYQHTSEGDEGDIAITRNSTPPVARAGRTQTELGHIAITCNSTPSQPPTGNFWVDTGLVVLLEPFGSELGLSYTWRNGHALVQEKLVE